MDERSFMMLAYLDWIKENMERGIKEAKENIAWLFWN